MEVLESGSAAKVEDVDEDEQVGASTRVEQFARIGLRFTSENFQLTQQVKLGESQLRDGVPFAAMENDIEFRAT